MQHYDAPHKHVRTYFDGCLEILNMIMNVTRMITYFWFTDNHKFNHTCPILNVTLYHSWRLLVQYQCCVGAQECRAFNDYFTSTSSPPHYFPCSIHRILTLTLLTFCAQYSEGYSTWSVISFVHLSIRSSVYYHAFGFSRRPKSATNRFSATLV